MHLQVKFLACWFVVTGYLTGCCVQQTSSSKETVNVIWGTEVVEHPLLQTLINAPVMQRIKEIDQSGPSRYLNYTPAFRRFDHCIGVWALLKRFGCALPEQAAGLLHDTSHTVFSHLGDYLFATPEVDASYQDTIHLWFLQQMNIEPILKAYGLSIAEMDPDRPEYRALEQDLPDLCADRIEYNLHTALLFKFTTQAEIVKIINDLRFEKGVWFFINLESARKFASFSLYFTEHFWGAPWNLVFNHYFKEIMQRALSLNLIDRSQIHFGVDSKVMDILLKSQDHYIQKRLQACHHITQAFKIVEDGQLHHLYFQPKFRGINPLVKKGKMLHHLTELDPKFHKAFFSLKQKCEKGYKIFLVMRE